MKLHYLELDGKRYPISYSISVEKNLENRFDKKELENIRKNKSDKMAEYTILLIWSMIESGIGYINAFGYSDDLDIPKKNGEYICPTQKQISYLVSSDNSDYITKSIKECIKECSKTEINVKKPKKKYQKNHQR